MKNGGSLSVWTTDGDKNAIYKHCQATERKRNRELSDRKKERRKMGLKSE